MEELWCWMQIGFASAGGLVGWLLGGVDGFIYALVAFMVIDYITGIMCAIVEKRLSSTIGLQGIFKKVTIFAMVAIGHMVDTLIIDPEGMASNYSPIRTAIVFFYIANEGLSLIENSSRLGLPVPKKLKDALAQLHGKDDE